MRQIQLTDDSVIKLRPCKLVSESNGRFGVIRRAGMRRVVVRAGGMEACNCFRQGCTIREAKLHIADRFHTVAESVDLRPLLRSLTNADMIASVDGKPLPELDPPSIYSAYRYYLRFHLKKRLLHLAYRKLPASCGKHVAGLVQRLDMKAILWPKAIQAEEHFMRLASTGAIANTPKRFARRYFHHLIRNIVDFQALEAMTPLEADRWLNRHVEHEGLEHLALLKSEGVPIILAGFHFSTTKLLSLLLMRRGYDVAQVWLPDGSVDMDAARQWMEELNQLRPEYGRFWNIPDFSLSSFRQLLDSLRNGRVLIWLADMFGHKEQDDENSLHPEWRESANRVFGMGQIQTDLAQSKLEVTVCGQRVYLNSWIGAFARLSGAAVVPAALIRKRGRMRLIVAPPLRMPARATGRHVLDLNRALFERLDSLLRLYPDQWFGWHTLCPVK